jgi:hypothetical protein
MLKNILDLEDAEEISASEQKTMIAENTAICSEEI